MRKNKMLFLAVVVLLAILLSGCEKFFGSVDNSEHVHEFKYISVDDEVHCRRCECGEVDGYDSIHTLEWKNIDSFETAYRECVYCKYKEYQRDLYTRPLSIHSSTDGDPGEASIVYFVADIESGSFEYNEEFDIHLKVSLGTYYLEDGPFHIKLAESPYYEIVGDNEYKVTELVPQENRQYVMNFTFRVKATNPCSLIEAFDFKVKFNPTELFLNHASQYSSDGTWYYNSSEEFFFGFKQVKFINDSKGMTLADRWDYRKNNRFFYDSINMELLSGVIDDDVYIDRLVEYFTGDRVDIWSDDIDTVAYRSKNIRAKMTLGDEYKYLFDNSQGNFAERRPLIARTILDILLQKGYITDEEYQDEKAYISERGYCDFIEHVLYENVPIADYVRENYYQFVCEENSTCKQNNTSNGLEGNSAALYLSNDKLSVGGDVDVCIYTEFSDSIESYTIEIQDDFSLSSEIRFINNEIRFSVTHDGLKINPHFKMKILLNNEEKTAFYADLYGYVDEETLYLSQWSENEAYNVFLSYEKIVQGKTLTYEEIEDILLELQSKETIVRAGTSEEVHDIFISGEFYWQELYGAKRDFPLQHTLILFYDRGAVNETFLGACYTDDEGKYSFSLTNDLSSTENGYDIVVKIVAAGEDIYVCHQIGDSELYEPYYAEYHLPDNIVSGTYDNISYTYGMVIGDNPDMTGQAFQISQAGIMASRYYEAMSNNDASIVPIIYPHTMEGEGCFYSRTIGANGSIHIVGNLKNDKNLFSYASWDVLMHEYGHFVAYEEEISSSPGGNHYIRSAMAEHYMSHFKSVEPSNKEMECVLFNSPTKFGENDCKLKGAQLAWSEGWATYFSMAAQEYAQEFFYLGAVDTVGDGEYSAYNFSGVIPVENFHEGTEDTEATVTAVLYDIYDSGTDSNNDNLALGHKVLWDLIIGSKAKTFDEFDDYFCSEYTNATDLKQYGKLLTYCKLAPKNIIAADDIGINCPTFSWTWTEDWRVVYFDDRYFQLNFYTIDGEKICSTPKQKASSNSITVSQEVWQNVLAVLDSGDKFYVSVTIFENHAPETDYEGEWFEFELSYNVSIVEENTEYMSTLTEGQYYWYAFTSTCSTSYIFKTTGDTNTVGALFSNVVPENSLNDMLAYNNDNGDDVDFWISYYIPAGQTVYIRISGNDWTAEGDFSFWIFGDHDYTHAYVSTGLYGHRAYCSCGASTLKGHDWVTMSSGKRCDSCLYRTSNTIVPVPILGLVEDDEDVALSKEDCLEDL